MWQVEVSSKKKWTAAPMVNIGEDFAKRQKGMVSKVWVKEEKLRVKLISVFKPKNVVSACRPSI